MGVKIGAHVKLLDNGLRRMLKKLVFIAIVGSACVLIGACGTMYSFIVSKPVAANLPHYGINVDGVNLFAYPQNNLIVRSEFAPGHVPVAQRNERRFSSHYYYEEPGRYSRPIRDPRYFIVELVIVPLGHVVSFDVSTVALVREQKQAVMPSHWYKGGAGVSMAPDKDLRTREPVGHCIALTSWGSMREASNDTIVLDTKYPSCIVLKYPVAPVTPTDNFAVSLSGMHIDGDKSSLELLNFAPSSDREFVGYRIGP